MEINFMIFLKATLEAVLVLVAISAVGVFLRKKGVLTDVVAESLTSLLTLVCVPCMSFLAIAPTVSLSYLAQLWLIPVYTICTIFIGLFIGFIAGNFVLATRPSVTVLLMVMTAFPNSTSLPLAMLHTLQQNLGLVGEGEWLDVSVGRSTVLFVSAMMIICRWTLGYYMLDPKQSWNQIQGPLITKPEVEMTDISSWYSQPLLSPLVEIDEFEDNAPCFEMAVIQDEDENLEEREQKREQDGQEEEREEREEATEQEEGEEGKKDRERRLEEGLAGLWERTTKFPAPVAAIFVAMIIGIIPFLKTLFFPSESDSSSSGESWGIYYFSQYFALTIVEAMDPFSEMTIPLGLLLIGASAVDGLSSVESLGFKVIFVACVCRLVIMPLISCFLVFIFVEVGLPNEPVVLLSVLLASAMPPETNLIVLVSLHHVLLSEFATLMVFNYLFFMLSTPVMTLFFALVIEQLSSQPTTDVVTETITNSITNITNGCVC